MAAALATQADIEAKKKAEEEAKAKAAEEAKKKAAAAALADVSARPSKYLTVVELIHGDGGIVNTYRSVRKLTVANSSKYIVSGVRADVEFLDDAGRSLGSVPVALTGIIGPGHERTFAVASGDLKSGRLQGKGTTYNIKWTNVAAIEPR